MNDLRSDKSKALQEPSPMEALNRTIEALEARLDGLPPTGNDKAHKVGPAAARSTTNPDRPAETPDPVAQIRQRQRRLDAFRARAAETRAAAARRAPEHQAESARPAAHAARAEPEPPKAAESRHSPPTAAPTTDGESDLREVAEALVALRHELRAEIHNHLSEDVARQIGALRGEIVQLRAPGERGAIPEAIRADLMQLHGAIEELGRARSDEELQVVRAEVGALRETIIGLAREETVRGLDNRWAEICEMMTEIDPGAVRDELSVLTKRIDEIRSAVAVLPDAAWSRQVEADVHALADAVERLAQHDAGFAELRQDFQHLDARLDEVSQAIVAAAGSSDGAVERASIERIEARLDQLDDADGLLAALAPHFEGLTARLEGLAATSDQGGLAGRLDELAARVAELSQNPASETVREIAGGLQDLSAKLDDLAVAMASGHEGPDAELLDRFETLVVRVEAQASGATQLPGLDALHKQLEEITDRLGRSEAASPASEGAVRGLEAQITHLSDLLNERLPTATGGDALAALEPRLVAIEDHLSQSQQDVITAASRAAEAAVASFMESADEYEGGIDELSAVAGLAEDLRALEKLNRASDERNVRTFTAIHETLVKIAERLESLDRMRPETDREESAAVHARLAGGKAAVGLAEDGPHGYADREQEHTLAGHGAGNAVAMAGEEVIDPPRSLLGKLAHRVRPGRTDGVSGRAEPEVGAPAEARETLEPTPPIDPSEALDSGAANEPLEPGSGTPDIDRILQKVREQQSAGVHAGSTAHTESEKADFIAAARRAAQAAAAEIENTSRKQSGGKKGKAFPGDASAKRRPILIAAGAVMLAVMSYPLLSNLVDEAAPPALTVGEIDEEPQMQSVGASDPAQAPSDAAPSGPPVTVPAATEESDEVEAPLPQNHAASPTIGAQDDGEDASATTASTAADEDLTSASTSASEAEAEFAATEREEAGTAQDSAETNDAEHIARVDALPDDIATIALVEAARKGDSRALFEIGARYTEGRGVEADLTEAAAWYRDAAERGLPPAQYRLGNLYEKGTGVERDLDEALRWYRAAADNGNVSAMHNLAVLHASRGIDGAPDYDMAAKWFEQAAEHGVADSQFNLAVLYARGGGVEQDLAQSYKWFAIAAREGDTDAATKRDEVANAMDEEALEEARAAVELWRPRSLDPEANTVELPEAWGVSKTRTAAIDMEQAVSNIQTLLNSRGFDAGAPDGVIGPKTAEAIKAFQMAEGMEPSGRIDEALVRALLEESSNG